MAAMDVDMDVIAAMDEDELEQMREKLHIEMGTALQEIKNLNEELADKQCDLVGLRHAPVAAVCRRDRGAKN